MRYLLIIGLVFLFSCNRKDNFRNGSQIDIISQDTFSYHKVDNKKIKAIRSNFLFKNLEIIKEPSNLIDFIRLDSIELNTLIKNYFPSGDVSLHSNQENINSNIEIFTILNEYEVCDNTISLIITDKNRNLISIETLAEWGGCEFPSKSSSIFINDSTIIKTE